MRGCFGLTRLAEQIITLSARWHGGGFYSDFLGVLCYALI
jgi:hypothetical protein